ncbi:MAG: Hpt domain-containing protein, partial [Haliea sp.]|nr:Hpt domain-containing protein [Haliea sp.]
LCLDPSRDAKCLLQTAESEVALLTPALAAVDIVSSPADAGLLPNSQQTDSAPVESTPEPEPAETIPAAFREVFLEESQEIIERLQSELPAWVAAPARDERLREIRRHFHTFKGNGNAVGLYTLGDLGRDVQDLLDRVLESQTPLDPLLPALLEEVLEALPELVATCGGAGYFDAARVRNLRNRCIGLGRGVADGR